VQDDTCSSPFEVAEPRFLDEMLKSFDVESIDPVCIKKTSMSGNHRYCMKHLTKSSR
jgi:hypothetical protein